MPGTPGFATHQDNHYVEAGATPSRPPGSRSTTSSAANGALIAYPGSQREPLLPVEEVPGATPHPTQAFNALRQRVVVPARYAPATLEMPRGAVVFLHGHLLHGSHPNRLRAPAPRAARDLRPPGQPLPAWRERAAQRDRRLRTPESLMTQLAEPPGRRPRTSPRRHPGTRCARQPLGFVDVGARGGVHELVEPVARCTAVLGFEPAADECARLRAELASGSPWARCEIEPQALAARPGRADLHVLSAATNSSLRPPNTAFTERYGMDKWRELERTELEVTTLDQVLFEQRRRTSGTGAS